MPAVTTSKNNPFPVMEHMTVKLGCEYLARKQSIGSLNNMAAIYRSRQTP